MALTNLRSGIFLAPFHPTNEDPTLAIRRDLELIEWLDRLGFEEAWIGEHQLGRLRDHLLARIVHRRGRGAHAAETRLRRVLGPTPV